MAVLIFIIGVILAVVLFSRSVMKSVSSDSGRDARIIDQIDTQHMENLPLEQQEQAKKVSNFCGSRFITEKDIHNYIVYNIGQDFLAMSGWDIWDPSVHEATGQFERVERGVVDKSVSILCYDPQYKLAKVQGKTGIYLASSNRCSCPDFRKRRLPCKHMYALAAELDGDIEKEIVDSLHMPLYGLRLALAGHLPKSSKGSGGIRTDISDRGGSWSDNIDEFDSSAVVVGTDTSVNRLERIKKFDLEVLVPEAIKDIFTPHKKFTVALPDKQYFEEH